MRRDAAVLKDNNKVLLHADGKGDVVFDKEFKPLVPDELPVGEQDPDRGGAEDR